MSGSEIVGAAGLVGGVLLLMVAGVGLVRLPDALCRGHAVAKATSLGIALILVGAWVRLGDEAESWKLLLAIVFQLGTIPVASQLLANAAFEKNLPRWRERPVDHSGVPPGNPSASRKVS